MEFKDYYKTLGVERGANDKEIKASYRKLARKYHPDVNPGNKKAEERFKEINEAYEVLGDSDKRKKYDQLGSNWEQILRDREFAKQYTRPDFEWQGEGGVDLNDFFEAFFGRQESKKREHKGTDIEGEIQLTLEELFNNVKKTIRLNAADVCPSCRGSGRTTAFSGSPAICRNCSGGGRVSRSRSVDVKIPKGIKDGSKIRLAGMGEEGRGRKGDLYLRVRLLPHKCFKPEGYNIYCDLPVWDYEAALGAEVMVPTLNGNVKLTIPPETQSGSLLRLKGKGLPGSEGEKDGDLYFKIKVIIPSGLSAKERELVSQFKKLREGREEDIRSQLF